MRSGKKQRGFAIGTILLAVILIAAIVSAIVVATRGSSGDAERERARLIAANLVQQTTTLSNLHQQLISSGQSRTSLAIAAVRFGDNSLGPFPNLLSNSADDYCNPTSQSANVTCAIDSPSFFQMPAAESRIFVNNALYPYLFKKWNSMHIKDFFDAQYSGRLTMFYLMNVQEDICRHYNSMARTLPLSAEISIVAEFSALTVLGASPPQNSGASFDPWFDMTSSTYNELSLSGGCGRTEILNQTVYTLYNFFIS